MWAVTQTRPIVTGRHHEPQPLGAERVPRQRRVVRAGTGDPQVPLIAAGLLLFTAGFFAAHSVASGWVGLRATSARAQASALYLFRYYLGSSIGGSLGGIAFEHGGWPEITGYVFVLLGLGLVGLGGEVLLFR